MRSIVLVDSRSPGIGNGLTYSVADFTVKPGSLVNVPLRKKSMEGLVLALEEKKQDEEFSIKSIEGVLSEEPLLSDAHLKTLQWMSDYYFCSLRQALTPFLPPPPWRTLLPKDVLGYRYVQEAGKLGKKQQIVLEYLNGKDWMPLQELRRHTGASAETLRTLVARGCISEEMRSMIKKTSADDHVLLGKAPELTPIQKEAYESMKADPRPSLLFGVTGSGKTEVYASLIADVAAQGKQSILLVPEILLTQHSIKRFEEMFDRDRIAVLHSRLTPSSRRLEWMRIANGEATLVIGSRSALFAPCKNLGLVIIDEEHEWTYKNEQTPRYHARETAEALTRFANAKLVLGTATPSLETWSRAKEGTYHIARLPERYMNRPLPTVKVIDLVNVRFGQHYPFSKPLIDAIADRLKKGEQTVLFLNRRGMASAVMCLKCRRRLTSPESQLPFTMHRDPHGRAFLLDHFSGVEAELPAACPYCGNHDLFPVGAGTQKLEDTLAALFPEARLLRADSDTLQYPEQMRLLLKKMEERQADILLGTQSVVKGLDLPGITLAAVMVADVGLSLPHFRAGERVFQLLTQLTGRSGRKIPGEVIIQTFRPDSAEVIAASQHRTEDYLEAELKLRNTLKYPPATQMIRFILRDEGAEKRAKMLHASILRLIEDNRLPAQAMIAPTLFGGGRVWHILLRGLHLRTLLPKLDLINVVVDIDPVDCI
ncbi:MAG TPA: primosomal protein N' [Candidatus Peribacteraceae bacterium]|nr:primosomal protein N' [Candidatus Peribacteraceae bacterium]